MKSEIQTVVCWWHRDFLTVSNTPGLVNSLAGLDTVFDTLGSCLIWGCFPICKAQAVNSSVEHLSKHSMHWCRTYSLQDLPVISDHL